ncbi:MAG: type II toxin-antitoxin system Phd/YefM family antitoxin [Planctomycetota bacterium]
MKSVSIRDARSTLSRILQDAERGAPTEITRYGKPVARIVPVPRTPKRLPSLRGFRDAQDAPAESLTDTVLKMREEDRY